MAEALDRSADYRVLRRLVPAGDVHSGNRRARGPDGHPARYRDDRPRPRKDEIIELGMVKFDYLPDGRIVGVRDIFSAFNEPSGPIPLEVSAITGITDEMVAGHRIDRGRGRLRRRRGDRDRAQLRLRPQVCRTLLAGVRADSMGLQRDRGRNNQSAGFCLVPADRSPPLMRSGRLKIWNSLPRAVPTSVIPAAVAVCERGRGRHRDQNASADGRGLLHKLD